MSDLVRRGHAGVQRRSSAALLAADLRSLVRERKIDSTILLLDVSGSMGYRDAGRRRRIDALRDVVAQLPPLRTLAFSSDVEELPDRRIPEPDGCTAMHLAFRRARELGAQRVAIVTDGLPDNQSAALDAARGLTVQIYYCGPDPRPKFLDDLASQCGGQAISIDLGSPQLASSQIRGYLCA